MFILFASCSRRIDVTYSVQNETNGQILIAFVSEHETDTTFTQLSAGRSITLKISESRLSPKEFEAKNDTLYQFDFIRISKDTLVSSKNFRDSKEWGNYQLESAIRYTLKIDDSDF